MNQEKVNQNQKSIEWVVEVFLKMLHINPEKCIISLVPIGTADDFKDFEIFQFRHLIFPFSSLEENRENVYGTLFALQQRWGMNFGYLEIPNPKWMLYLFVYDPSVKLTIGNEGP